MSDTDWKQLCIRLHDALEHVQSCKECNQDDWRECSGWGPEAHKAMMEARALFEKQEKPKWKDNAVGRCGQYHEAQARALEHSKQMLNGASLCGIQPPFEQMDRDIAMHREFAKACLEAQ